MNDCKNLLSVYSYRILNSKMAALHIIGSAFCYEDNGWL